MGWVFKTTVAKHLCHSIHYNQKSKNQISNERIKQNTKIILIADERNLVCYFFYAQNQKLTNHKTQKWFKSYGE